MRRPTAERTGDRHRGARRLPGWSTLPARVERRGGGDVPTPPVSLCLSYHRVYGTVARADIIFLRASICKICRSWLLGSDAVPNQGRAALVGADVGCLAGVAVAEVGDDLARARTGTARGKLETAGPGRRIEAGVGGVDRLAADPVHLRAL